MIALQIKSVKNLMNHMLASETFDSFLLQEASLATAVKYEIDGRINREFYPEEERDARSLPYEFQPWSEARANLLALIKGKHSPTFFRFVLQLKPESADLMLLRELPEGNFENVRALLINVKYDGHEAVITTGTSYETFVMDRTADQIWDRAFARFLSLRNIEFELL